MLNAIKKLKEIIYYIESKPCLLSSNEASILNDHLRTFIYNENQITSPKYENSKNVLTFPNELHNIIFEFLDYTSIIRVACTSRVMRDFFNINFAHKLNSSFGNFVTIGSNIDALDRKGVWYPSVVIATTSTTLRVRFNGFSSKWDEDYERSSTKIVPVNTNSRAINTKISPVSRVAMYHPPSPTSLNGDSSSSNSPSIQEPPRWGGFPSYSTDSSPQSVTSNSSLQLTPLLLPVSAQQVPKMSLNNFEFTHAPPISTSFDVSNTATSRPMFAAARRFVPKQQA